MQGNPNRLMRSLRRPGPAVVRNFVLAEFGSVGAAIAATYLLDPQQGRRRRATLRDKIGKGFRQSQRAAGKVGRDLRNRTQGVIAESRAFASGTSSYETDGQPGRLNIFQENWAPATRAIAGAAGAILILFGLRHSGISGLALASSGGALLLRAATNAGLKDVAERAVEQSGEYIPS